MRVMIILLGISLIIVTGVAGFFASRLSETEDKRLIAEAKVAEQRARCEAAEIRIKDAFEAQCKLDANKKRLAEIVEEQKSIAQGIINEYERTWRERDFSSYRIYQLEKIQNELKELMEELEE